MSAASPSVPRSAAGAAVGSAGDARAAGTGHGLAEGGPTAGRLARLIRSLPTGRELPGEQWQQHHRFVLRTLAALAVAVVTYALVQGHGVVAALGFASPVVLLAGLASAPILHRGERAVLSAVGLMTAAAVVVHIAGGRTEAHFLFFALLPLAALYATPVPFVAAVGFVGLHHFVLGSLAHGSVFMHGQSVTRMAMLHAVFILVESWACFVAWRRFEDRRDFVERLVLERTGQLRAHRDELVRLAAVVQSTDDAVLTVDRTGRLETWNPGAEQLYGYRAAEVLGRHVGMLFAPGTERLATTAIPSDERTSDKHVERLHRRKDGSVFEALITISAIRDADGAITGHAAIARDISAQKRARIEAVSTARRLQEQAGELTRLAMHDSLTGLANRALMHDRLGDVLSRRRTSSAAVLLLDLDDFKSVNDVFGHRAGDAVLAEISRRLVSSVRPEDTVARLGGDEFVVLVDAAHDTASVVAMAERLLAAISASIYWTTEVFEVGCSIGITLIDPLDERGTGEVLRDADIAMYAAKTGGRNRSALFEPEMRDQVIAHSQLLRDLRLAVAGEQFCLFYQPQVDLVSGEIRKVEALTRWQHPQRGLVAPDVFITIAETAGLVDLIDDWALQEACRQMSAWDAAGWPALRVAVNVSARRLARGDLAETIVACAQKAGVEPARLEIEITETGAVSCASQAAGTLRDVRALGVSIAIDDFGMGHSSFSRLQALPVDRLKIDRSFVGTLTAAAAQGSIAGAMVALGGSLGLDVVAEGVETRDQLEALRALGCPTGQGYFFGRPVPADELVLLLASDVRA